MTRPTPKQNAEAWGILEDLQIWIEGSRLLPKGFLEEQREKQHIELRDRARRLLKSLKTKGGKRGKV